MFHLGVAGTHWNSSVPISRMNHSLITNHQNKHVQISIYFLAKKQEMLRHTSLLFKHLRYMTDTLFFNYRKAWGTNKPPKISLYCWIANQKVYTIYSAKHTLIYTATLQHRYLLYKVMKIIAGIGVHDEELKSIQRHCSKAANISAVRHTRRSNF